MSYEKTTKKLQEKGESRKERQGVRMIKAKITTYQDEYYVIKIHWSDVQVFYGKDDNNNGYVYGIEVNHKDNETECFWFKTEQERDMEYIERGKNE